MCVDDLCAYSLFFGSQACCVDPVMVNRRVRSYLLWIVGRVGSNNCAGIVNSVICSWNYHVFKVVLF